MSEEPGDVDRGGEGAPTEAEGVAPRLRELLVRMFGTAPEVGVTAWDGSSAGEPSDVVVHIGSRRTVRRLLWNPGTLGLARAYVTGELDVRGDLLAAIAVMREYEERAASRGPLGPADRRELLRTTVLLGAVGPAPRAPSDPLDAVAGYAPVDDEMRLLLPDELSDAVLGASPPGPDTGDQRSEVYITHPEPLSVLVARWESEETTVREVTDVTTDHAQAVARWASGLDAHREAVVEVVGERQARVWRLSLALDQDHLERGRVRAYRVVGIRASGTPS